MGADGGSTARSPARAWLACAWAFGSVAACAALGEAVPSVALYPLLVLFIGARQHTLYVLNHDASHGNLFASRSANQRFATVFCLWPFFHHAEAFSSVLWRRVHLLHHAKLFTDGDPNYVGRRERGDTQVPMTPARLLLGLARAPFDAVRGFFFGRQDYVAPGAPRWEGERRAHLALLFLPQRDAELDRERFGKLVAFAAVGAGVFAAGGGMLLWKYWIVPMYTAYPVILRLMDLTEHNWNDTSGRLELQANSRRYPRILRLFVSDLSRELHWEHHLAPAVPFFRLRELSRSLRGPQAPVAAPLRGAFELLPAGGQ